MPQCQNKPINPHFDHDRIIWKDEYSGEYQPINYDNQFDKQWELFLQKKIGFYNHTGVETSDRWIDGRIYELTGVKNFLERQKFKSFLPFVSLYRKLTDNKKNLENIGGRLLLEPKFDINHFQGKNCLDVACGAGRWSKTLISLGAHVKSIDVSENALKSVSRFNNDFEKLNVFNIKDRSDLHHQFDFTIAWGVIMSTHDCKSAFDNVALTVKPGGELYVMIYAPTYHNSDFVVNARKHYHMFLNTFEERLNFAYSISDKPENCISQFDMLNPFYNWTIEEETIYNWYFTNGFQDVITLNKNENNYCAYHILGKKLL